MRTRLHCTNSILQFGHGFVVCDSQKNFMRSPVFGASHLDTHVLPTCSTCCALMHKEDAEGKWPAVFCLPFHFSLGCWSTAISNRSRKNRVWAGRVTATPEKTSTFFLHPGQVLLLMEKAAMAPAELLIALPSPTLSDSGHAAHTARIQ